MTETVPEFTSIILTIDEHSGQQSGSANYVQKIVASDQDLTETILSLLNYYGHQALLSSAATIRQLQILPTVALPAFVLRTQDPADGKPKVEIILTPETLTHLIASANGSIMLATQLVATMAGKAINDTEEAAGGAVPLILFSFSDTDHDADSDSGQPTTE